MGIKTVDIKMDMTNAELAKLTATTAVDVTVNWSVYKLISTILKQAYVPKNIREKMALGIGAAALSYYISDKVACYYASMVDRIADRIIDIQDKIHEVQDEDDIEVVAEEE